MLGERGQRLGESREAAGDSMGTRIHRQTSIAKKPTGTGRALHALVISFPGYGF